MIDLPTFDSRDFRNALGMFATGVTIITARRRSGETLGVTINSFSSVSLDPPLILWSQSVLAPSLSAFQDASHFIVNVLAEGQRTLAERFCKPQRDRFADVDCVLGAHDVPMILGCAAYFECQNVFRYYGGDHLIFVGRVQKYSYSNMPPLIFCRGKYLRNEQFLKSEDWFPVSTILQ
jgi:flavin reductase (DIM6/NTAB) family NADH-FMN oxidoreductase RutF